MRTFNTGANRDSDEGKLDYEAYLSPIVLQRFAEYMLKNATLPDGSVRSGDNWQKGFGDDHLDVCMKSLMRHLMDMWLFHRGFKGRDSMDEAIYGALFNLMAYAHWRETHDQDI